MGISGTVGRSQPDTPVRGSRGHPPSTWVDATLASLFIKSHSNPMLPSHLSCFSLLRLFSPTGLFEWHHPVTHSPSPLTILPTGQDASLIGLTTIPQATGCSKPCSLYSACSPPLHSCHAHYYGAHYPVSKSHPLLSLAYSSRTAVASSTRRADR